MPLSQPLPSYLAGPFRHWQAAVTPQPSLPQAEQPQLSQPFLPAEGFQPSDHCWGLLCPAPTAPGLSCAEGSRAGRRTPGGSHQSRAEGHPCLCLHEEPVFSKQSGIFFLQNMNSELLGQLAPKERAGSGPQTSASWFLPVLNQGKALAIVLH